MRRNRRTITIQDVAREAGVSVSTVSRVLNKKTDVALETQEKIEAVIKGLGYASSLAARGMRSHRTNVIGLVLPDISVPYATEVMRGVNQVIANVDYDLIIYTNGNFHKSGTADQQRHLVTLLNGSITDGVLVVAGATTEFPTTAPVVIIDPNNECPEFPSLIATNREGAQEAMRYLIGLGHRRIGHITGRLDLLSAHQRLQGYKDGLAEAGIPYDEQLVKEGDYTASSAIEGTKALLALPEPPTAIFAANDMTAMGVYEAAGQVGVCIPDRLSVIGFDNLRDALYLRPSLTTVDQNLTGMGKIAAEMIIKLVQGEPLENRLVKIQTHLMVRDSCISFP